MLGPKSQELGASITGLDGSNQLVFDDSAAGNESRNRWLNVLSPVGGAGVAMWTGLPSAEVRYWPDRATYPDFFVDGRSAEEASESEEAETEMGPSKAAPPRLRPRAPRRLLLLATRR